MIPAVPSLNFDALPLTRFGIGAPAIQEVEALEVGMGPFHQTILTFRDVPITVRDTEQGGGIKIYDMPVGGVNFLGAFARDLTVTTKTAPASTLNAAASAGRIGIGTTTQANPTLATTEQNIIPVTTFTPGAQDVPSAAVDANLATAFILDGAGTAIDWFLNISVPTATDIDGDAIVWVNGDVWVTWIHLGLKA